MKKLILGLLLIAAPSLGDVVSSASPRTTGSGGGSLSSGTTPIAGCQNLVVYGNNANLLECEAGLGYDTATNILTVPNATLAGTENVTGSLYFSNGGTLGDSTITKNTTLTPDNLYIGVGTTGECVHIGEYQDAGFDLNNGRAGTAAAGDPCVILHSRNQQVNQYIELISQNATGAGEIQTNLGEIMVGGNKCGITEASAISLLRIGIPSSTNVYGATVFYTVYDINAANYVTRTGSVKVQGGNSGGTATCTINTTQDQETEDGSQIATSNAATLTYTWTNAVSTTNCDLQINAASSEGVNTYCVTYTATITGNSSAITATPQ